MIKPIQQKKTFAERIDSFVGIFSPLAGARRKYFRFLMGNMLGAYQGAEGGRLRGYWAPGGGSADQDLHPDLAKLRERSRDLIRNDGIASGAIDTIITNIIGSGIRMQSRIDKEALDISQDIADKLQKKIEKIWERWVPHADAGNRQTFYGIEELSERQRFINGESIIVPLRIMDSQKKRPYSLALQIVESDRLDTPSDLRANKNIRSGVEVGQYGEPIVYYIRKNHPGDFLYSRGYSNSSENFIKYPAYNDLGDPNFFHLYHVKRSGQTRGEPFFSPVLSLFKDRVDYMEAEIVAARVAACFAVFIKKNNAYQTGIGRSQTENNKRVEELSPGVVEYLNENEEIQGFNPNRPGGTFGMFMERVLRDISAGLNIPYEILAKDFSKSNYSNTRAALLEARRFFMMQQRFIADNLCQHILIMLLEEAYLKGELAILDFYQNRDAYVRTRWIAPGWQWVDPENEVNAAVDGVDNNLSTLAEESAAQGQDWEEILEQRARELKKIKELEEKNGISMTIDKTPKPAEPQNPIRKSNAKNSKKSKDAQPAQGQTQ